MNQFLNVFAFLFIRRKRATEQKAQSLKNSMRESFNRISSSMSAVIVGSDSKARQPGHPIGRGAGAAGPRGIGRGAGRGTGRGRSRGGGMGPGRGIGNSPGRTHPPGVNTPLQNSKATPEKQKPKPAKTKQKKKKQKKGKDSGAVSLEFIFTR